MWEGKPRGGARAWCARVVGEQSFSFWDFFKETQLGQLLKLEGTEEALFDGNQRSPDHAKQAVYIAALNYYCQTFAQQQTGLTTGIHHFADAKAIENTITWGCFKGSPEEKSAITKGAPAAIEDFVAVVDKDIASRTGQLSFVGNPS